MSEKKKKGRKIDNFDNMNRAKLKHKIRLTSTDCLVWPGRVSLKSSKPSVLPPKLSRFPRIAKLPSQSLRVGQLCVCVCSIIISSQNEFNVSVGRLLVVVVGREQRWWGEKLKLKLNL